MDQPTQSQAPATTPRMLRAGAVADMLDIPKARVYEFARRGLIPHVRVGASVRFDVEQVESWIRAGGTAYARDDE